MLPLERTIRYLRILLLVGGLLISGVLAADITVNTAETAEQVLNEGDTITVTATGSVSTSALATPAVTGSNINEGSNTVTLEDGAVLSTSGGGADVDNSSFGIRIYGTQTDAGTTGLAGTGALADGASNIVVLQSGSIINTTGEYAAGIHADNNNSITVNGTITTEGEAADAVYCANNNLITVNGDLITSGMDSCGIYAVSNNDITVNGSITIETIGGLGIYSGGKNNITVTGDITTYSLMSCGIWSDADGDTITVSGSIVTLGTFAYGITSLDNNNITLSGSITTSGATSNGICCDNSNTVTVSGSITTAGISALGIGVIDSNTVDFSGSIVTTGNMSSGIYSSDNNSITSSGSIITYGDDSTGIDVLDENDINFSGTIQTSGEWAFGIYGYDNNTITASGDITTTGSDATGIDIANNNIVTVSGSIVTTGSGADAINLFNNNNVCYLSGTISATGSGALAINSGSGLTGESNCIHLLSGASITGGIKNSDLTATSYLTFGYAKAADGTAILTAVDDSFNITISDNITSDSSGNWDGYFAGGTTTLSGTVNSFRNLFIGGDCFDGATVAAGNDGAGSAKTATLSSISGATAVLNVTNAISTTGSVTVGAGSTYNLYGTHTGSGNFTLANGSIFNLELTSSKVSKLIISGTADLVAGNVNIAARGGQSGTTYTLIEASAVAGSFSLTDYSALLDYTVDSSSGTTVEVTANLIANAYKRAAATGDGTNMSLAGVLDILSDDHPVSMDDLFGAMNEFSTLNEVNKAMSQLNVVNSAASTINLALGAAHSYNNALNKQLSVLRLGTAAPAYGSGTGFTSAGGIGDISSPAELKEAYSSIDTYAPEVIPSWSGFMQLYGGFGEQRSKGDCAGYDYNHAGVISGLDYRFSRELSVGSIIDYNYSRSKIYSHMGDGSDKVLRLGTYAAYQWNNLFIDTAPSVAAHMIKTYRSIDFLNTTAEGKRTGIDFNWMNTIGYEFGFDSGYSLTPAYSLAFTDFYEPGYTETGAGSGADLKVSDYSCYSLLQNIDVRISRLFEINDSLILLPEIWGGWELEYLDSGTDVTSAFAAAPDQSWTVNIATVAPNRVIFGAAVTALINENTSILCRYGQKLWSGGYETDFSIGLKISF